MKRKVAKIGPSTLMISLPSKWCKHFNIQKGAELDIEEQGSELKIKTEGNKAQHEITIDIRNLNERTIKWILGVPNKKGYDIINVLHNANQLNLVNDSFKNIYIGFVITDQTEEKTVFKKVSLETKEEFDPILRRTFLITVSLAEKVVNNLKDRNHKKLKEHLSLERTNNLLVDHCHRLLVKFGYQNYEKTSFYFLLCWNLEKLADEYKYLINYFSNKNDLKLTPEAIKILEKTKEKVYSYYNLFYNFNVENLDKLTEETKNLINELSNWNQKTNTDIAIQVYSLKILDRLDNFSSTFVGINS